MVKVKQGALMLDNNQTNKQTKQIVPSAQANTKQTKQNSKTKQTKQQIKNKIKTNKQTRKMIPTHPVQEQIPHKQRAKQNNIKDNKKTHHLLSIIIVKWQTVTLVCNGDNKLLIGQNFTPGCETSPPGVKCILIGQKSKYIHYDWMNCEFIRVH